MGPTDLQKKIIAMLREGYSASTIARALKCSRRYVYYVAQKYGLEVPTRIDKQLMLETLDVAREKLLHALNDVQLGNVGSAVKTLEEVIELLNKAINSIQFMR